MMIRQLREGDLDAIATQSSQIDEVMWGAVDFEGVSFSGWDGDRCLGAAGLTRKWQGTSVAWALLADGWQHHALPITKFVRYVIANDPAPRIEAYVRSDNNDANRWAWAVGLECEAEKLEGFGPGGEAMNLFARIR